MALLQTIRLSNLLGYHKATVYGIPSDGADAVRTIAAPEYIPIKMKYSIRMPQKLLKVRWSGHTIGGKLLLSITVDNHVLASLLYIGDTQIHDKFFRVYNVTWSNLVHHLAPKELTFDPIVSLSGELFPDDPRIFGGGGATGTWRPRVDYYTIMY